MARLKRGAKTQAVRDYLDAHPDASPKEIVEGLKAQGMKVKITLVNGIKYNKRSKPGRRKRRSLVAYAAARRTSLRGVTIEQLLEVKRIADALGGADQLRQALDTLEQFR
jgi:hypothetical protein